ncbi:CaiB/BaiF CoA-transferase family protein [Nocardioides sp. zg-1228]|uniref:CaiB/BaiF CoA transferase family protein n=1 Tax=Nocardioides sp. zg-1228 TaxID=2763008 RepID=UPI00164357B9|nr:CoA transferase [Nocardioides sp. zg-1228]MBC2935151.1 CoA transferase [Nocardioides sp. zg-1228]QSF56978.1 CoA transferase [Nocardioides sp. zg-1228]
MTTEVAGPLAGTVVLDLSRALAGPHAAMMLADMGARVIKVETATGDDSRGWGPPFVGPEDDPVSTYYLSANRNKESVRLDLKTPTDSATLAALVAKADVLIENFRPGVLDRLGFPVTRLAEINPRLVVLSISGFGHDGPEGGRAGYDQIAQGEGGLMSLTGPDPQHPTKVGVPIADLLAGMNGAFGVATALAARERTGRGTVVRTSLLAAIVSVHAFQGTRWTVAGEVPQASGNHHPAIAPYGSFRAADGMIQAAVGNDQQWRVFAGCLGLDPDDPRFTTSRLRVDHRPELIEAIEERLATAPADTWLARLDEAGVPAGRIRTIDQVYEWDQTISQGLVVEVDHPTLGPVRLPGPPLRFESPEGEPAGRTSHSPPPLLGEHDDAIRAWAAESPSVGQ